MKLKETWINNNGVNIHVIDSNPIAKQELPFVIVPGLSESAEDYLLLMESLSPRRCVAISLRGRGKSDAPQTGYKLEDHISDIEAVVKYLELSDMILMGFSRGVSYALGYALANPQVMKGLILGDYPAYHSELPPEWVPFFSSLPPWRGKPLSERMKPHALKGLQKDSKLVLFWDKLHSIECPVIVIRGGKQGAVLTEEDGARYLEHIPNANLVVFEESDHNIFEPTLDKMISIIKGLFETIECGRR